MASFRNVSCAITALFSKCNHCYFNVISQYILGIKPDFDGLRINPVIPEAWDGYQVIRKFRGATYRIEVTNPNHVSSGIKEILLNHMKITGSLIPVCEKGSVNEVKVVMG